MKTFVFTDLDDTLICSRRKCAKVATTDLEIAAYSRTQQPVSFLTPKQKQLKQLLEAGATLIPVTARNTAAFSRTVFRSAELAVTNFGATILRNGRRCDEWHQRGFEATSKFTCTCESIRDRLQELFPGISSKIIMEDDLAVYIAVQTTLNNAADQEQLLSTYFADFETAFVIEDLFFQLKYHYNGRQLAVFPIVFDKQYAVQHLISELCTKYGDILTLGIGDSKTDMAFLKECDYLMCPSNSQIVNKL